MAERFPIDAGEGVRVLFAAFAVDHAGRRGRMLVLLFQDGLDARPHFLTVPAANNVQARDWLTSNAVAQPASVAVIAAAADMETAFSGKSLVTTKAPRAPRKAGGV